MRETNKSGVVGLIVGFLVGVGLFAAIPVNGAPLLDPLPSAPQPQRGYFVQVRDERVTAVRAVALPPDDAVAAVATPPAAERTPTEVPAWLTDDPCSAAAEQAGPLHSREIEGCRAARAQEELRVAVLAQRQALLPAMRSLSEQLGQPEVPIERACTSRSASGECQRRSMDNVFQGMLDTAMRRRQEPLRVTVWGDSLVASDYFTGELRELLQSQFGGSGHGFIHIGVPDRPVTHVGMNVSYAGEWAIRTIIRHSAHDPLFGLAGVAFDASAGPSVRISPQGSDRGISRVGVLMFRRAENSSIRVQTPDGAEMRELGGEARSSHVEWIEFNEPVAWVRLSAFGPDRFFAVLEDGAGPGVVVDNLGLVSSREARLSRIDEDHWKSQVELRGTDLLTFFYGANVADENPMTGERQANYQRGYEEVLNRAASMEGRDCMVISVLTRGERSGGRVRPVASVPGLNEAQRAAANESGCAFWSAYEAIGAEDSAARWHSARPQLLGADLSHPTRAGYRELSRLFYQALIASFVEWLEET